MARAMWKGSIAFGLVNIPIELYSATRDHRPKFRLLHAKDESPVRYERVCQTRRQTRRLGRSRQGLRVREGPVRRPHQGRLQDRRAREDEDDRHPRLRRSEGDRRALFRDAVLPAARQGRRRAYALLREAIRDSDRIGIAKIILRDAQHLAAVEAIGDALVLTMMRFADELADLGEFRFPKAEAIRPRS